MSIGLDVVNDATGDGIRGASQDSAGLHGIHTGAKNGFGVLGDSQNNIGVAGASLTSTAVAGISFGKAIGVLGIANAGHGVTGMGQNGVGGWGSATGVYGEATAGQGAVSGVLGVAHGPTSGVTGFTDDGMGVFGQAHSAKGTGIYGDSSGGAGVHGGSDTGIGVMGGSSSGTGVAGFSNSDIGVAAFTATDKLLVPALLAVGTNAAEFDGNVRIVGNLTTGERWIDFEQEMGDIFVNGSLLVVGDKMAVVPHPDGFHRALYCVESPESWFEDFGRARLVRGKARVKLERTFAAVVRTGDYHVFLSPEGESHGLYVSRRGRDGFDVREEQHGTSTVRFSYRIVARRKDITAPRFKKIRVRTRPAIGRLALRKRFMLPVPPTVPAHPPLPALPALPPRPARPPLQTRSERAGRVGRAAARTKPRGKR